MKKRLGLWGLLLTGLSALSFAATAITVSSITKVSPTSALASTLYQAKEDSDTYYKGITVSKTGTALRTEVANLITSTHDTSVNSYNALTTQFTVTDVNPDTGKGMLWFYTGTQRNGYDGSSNREHVWPKDGGNAFPEKTGPGCDLQHLRPCDSNLNSSRGSLSYDEVDSSTGSIVKEAGSTVYDNPCYRSSSFFCPGVGYRGATARILMYMQTRWGNQYSLKFVDSAGNCKTIGKISTLMKWHLTEPPTASEKYRNQKAYEIQGNRNPFIDHPEWASRIYCYDGESYNAALQSVVNQYGDYDVVGTVYLDKSSVAVEPDESFDLNARLTIAGGLVSNVLWTCDNYDVCYFTGTTAGATVNIATLSEGVANITAYYKFDETKKATCRVVVAIQPPVPIPNNLIVSGSMPDHPFQKKVIDVSGITATAVYTDGSIKDVTNKVAYNMTSFDPNKLGSQALELSYTDQDTKVVGYAPVKVTLKGATGERSASVSYATGAQVFSDKTIIKSTGFSGYSTVEDDHYVRLGSGKSTGTMTLYLSSSMPVNKVQVKGRCFGSDTGTFTVSTGSSSVTKDIPGTTVTTVDFDFAETSVSTVSISTDAKGKRIQIETVTVYTGSSFEEGVLSTAWCNFFLERSEGDCTPDGYDWSEYSGEYGYLSAEEQDIIKAEGSDLIKSALARYRFAVAVYGHEDFIFGSTLSAISPGKNETGNQTFKLIITISSFALVAFIGLSVKRKKRIR